MSALDRIEALAVPVVYDRETGVRIFPDGLIPLLVAVARAAEDIERHNSLSTESAAVLSVYRSPADEMRLRADNVEAADRRLRTLRAALAAVVRYADEHLPDVTSDPRRIM